VIFRIIPVRAGGFSAATPFVREERSSEQRRRSRTGDKERRGERITEAPKKSYPKNHVETTRTKCTALDERYRSNSSDKLEIFTIHPKKRVADNPPKP
jgi:hypothetical protein